MNAEFLKGVGLFEGLNNDQLAEILMLGMVKDYKTGAVIFEEGGPGRSILHRLHRGGEN